MKLKRYLLFSGYDYEGLRGWDTFYGTYATEKEGLEAAWKIIGDNLWWQLIDVKTNMEIELSLRARTVLKNIIKLRGDGPHSVSRLTREELRAAPNCGALTVAEIERWLKKYKLRLAAS
jgi:hypothetical protein